MGRGRGRAVTMRDIDDGRVDDAAGRIARLFILAAESDEKDFAEAREALRAEIRALTRRPLPTAQALLAIAKDRHEAMLPGLATFDPKPRR